MSSTTIRVRAQRLRGRGLTTPTEWLVAYLAALRRRVRPDVVTVPAFDKLEIRVLMSRLWRHSRDIFGQCHDCDATIVTSSPNVTIAAPQS